MHLKATLLVALSLFAATPAMAFDLPGGSSEPDENVVAVKKDAAALVTKTQKSTLALLNGIASFHEATGNKTALADLQPLIKALTEAQEGDVKVLKQVGEQLAKLSDGVTKTRLTVHVPTEAEKAKFKDSITGVGTAFAILKSAGNDANALTSKSTEVASGAVTNPFALIKLKSVIETSAFLAGYLPTETGTATSLADSVRRYASQLKIELPTLDDVAKAAGLSDNE